MSIQDPISDLITQIRNGYLAKKDSVTVFSSKTKISILKILKNEHFIEDYILINNNEKILKVKITLKYYGKKEAILKKIIRISKPSVRIYSGYKKIPKIGNGFGLSIISTSKGIMTDKEAKNQKCGGEILCTIE